MQRIQRVQSLRQARKQQGFTIIELVVVILLLGILAATALPRFMDVTDEAHESVVSSLQGGLSTGAALFRAQWYGKGQPRGVAVAEFGNGTLFANTSGYPVGSSATFNASSCLDIYNGVLQSGRPTAVAATGTAGTPVAHATLTAATITTTATPAVIETAANDVNDVVIVTGTNAVYCKTATVGSTTCSGNYYTTSAADAAADLGGAGSYTTLAAAQAAALNSGSCTLYYTGQYKDRQTGLDGTAATPGQPVKGLETLVLSLSNGEVTRSITAYEP